MENEEYKFGILRRKRDDHTSMGEVRSVKWAGDGDVGSKVDKMEGSTPKVGNSIIIGADNPPFDWLTTPITEIISEITADEDELGHHIFVFTTRNSTYTLTFVSNLKKL